MNKRALIAKLQPFVGRQLIACIDEIKKIALAAGCSDVLARDPETPASIDEEPKRLNVRTDADFNITSFTIG
jgi:hypothetical protein